MRARERAQDTPLANDHDDGAREEPNDGTDHRATLTEETAPQTQRH